MEFQTANNRRVIECPKCASFTMTEPDGSWACRGCAGSMIAYVAQVIKRKGFRPKRVTRRVMLYGQ